MREFNTNFEFKDNRQYIHSTTMIEELCTLTSEYYYSEKKWGTPLIDAKFHKEVLHNGRFLISEDAADFSENTVVSANFRFYDQKHNITAVLIEDEGANVVRRIKTSYSVEEIILERDFSGICKIGCKDRIAYVENVIEANKRLHLTTLKHMSKGLKVINLYMKRFPVYPNREKYDYIMLKIENISMRKRNGSIATLNSLSFPQLKLDPFEIAYIIEGI